MKINLGAEVCYPVNYLPEQWLRFQGNHSNRISFSESDMTISWNPFDDPRVQSPWVYPPYTRMLLIAAVMDGPRGWSSCPYFQEDILQRTPQVEPKVSAV